MHAKLSTQILGIPIYFSKQIKKKVILHFYWIHGLPLRCDILDWIGVDFNIPWSLRSERKNENGEAVIWIFQNKARIVTYTVWCP